MIFLDADIYKEIIDKLQNNGPFLSIPDEHNKVTTMSWNGDPELTKPLDYHMPENKYVNILLNKNIKTSIFGKFIENKSLPEDMTSRHGSTSIQLDCFRDVYKFPIHTDICGKIITMRPFHGWRVAL